MIEITLNLSGWTRLAEVQAYAREQQLPLDQAIKQLVNTGLSFSPQIRP